jgi:hypothetical protein
MRQGHREARTKLSKSKIIEEAIRVWERTRLATLAREGYQGMASEDLADAEAYVGVLDDLSDI